jgi:hypothetical protein
MPFNVVKIEKDCHGRPALLPGVGSLTRGRGPIDARWLKVIVDGEFIATRCEPTALVHFVEEPFVQRVA